MVKLGVQKKANQRHAIHDIELITLTNRYNSIKMIFTSSHRHSVALLNPNYGKAELI